ncbi:hypothetical protein KSP39_PZI000259 [Platanthera zijinensis]|uniref:Uncharacterized protein n=1 Tax=Platanthera zijinensis TaxID=2320716 RepID=A0AAP0C2H8_9ASPA
MSRVRACSESDMARMLRWDDHVGLGICRMPDTGVFVSNCRVVRNFAAPAVIVSYAIAGLCALLSAFYYAEFVFDLTGSGLSDI